MAAYVAAGYVAEGYVADEIATPTPAERTFVIAAESRTFAIPA